MAGMVVARGMLAATGDTTRVAPQTLNAGQSWAEATHIVPPPQRPLMVLEDGIGPVREAFRAADGMPRVILLMSPT
jgi:predicted dienelactone hydrolase